MIKLPQGIAQSDTVAAFLGLTGMSSNSVMKVHYGLGSRSVSKMRKSIDLPFSEHTVCRYPKYHRRNYSKYRRENVRTNYQTKQFKLNTVYNTPECHHIRWQQAE